MPVALILSIALHLALVLVVIFGLPRWSEPVATVGAVQVSLVSVADLTGQPQPAPLPEPDPPEVVDEVPDAVPEPAAPDPGADPTPAPTPPPPVERVAPTPSPDSDLPDGPTVVAPRAAVSPEIADPQPEPVPQAPREASPETITEAVDTSDENVFELSGSPVPAPRPVRPRPPEPDVVPDPQPAPVPVDPVASAVADALNAVNTPPQTPGPVGPPLTSDERDALRVAVGSCWNFAGMSTEAMRVTIVVAMDMSPDGKVVAGTMALKSFEGGNRAAADVAYRAARSAIFRCQGAGYSLPVDKYDQWKQIEMTFNPERMRQR